MSGTTQEDQKSKQVPPVDKGKVLILDDEDCITAVASKMLIKIGYSVETACNGEQAIQLFKSAKDEGRPFDILILDLAIASGMGGKEVIGIIRAEDSSVKAIVSSGYCDDPIMANYQKYGFDCMVSKPYTFSALTIAVNSLMEDND